MTTSYVMEEKPERRAERLRAEHLTVRCADCEWTFEGRADIAMCRHRDHRVKRHGRPESSDFRWQNEPPKGKAAHAKPKEEPPREPSVRERAIELLRERGESTSSELGAELSVKPGSVSSALGWSVRRGLVQSRSKHGSKEKLWRIAGTEPGVGVEPPPAAAPTVEDALAAAGRPMTVDEVAAATGRAKDSVYTALTTALRSGLAERVARGVYRIAQ